MTRQAARAAMLAGLLAAVAVACGGSDSGGEPQDVQLAAVIKGLDNPFFRTMRDGLTATAQARDARLIIATAADLYDTTGQSSNLESLVAGGADCYVVNPITRANLVQSLRHVPEQTPIVNIDSPVDQSAARAVGVKILTYIGTDNVAGGRLGAETMAGLVRSGARIALIKGTPGDATSEARARGFLAGNRGRFKVARSVSADFDRGRGELAGQQVLDDDPRIAGFFAVNDEMALGVSAAVKAAGREGELAVVGFDGTSPALDAVERGAMSATVSQYPYAMGRLAVHACLAAVRGKTVPPVVDAPAQVITKTNVARARARFPQPVEPFDDPLARLLED